MEERGIRVMEAQRTFPVVSLTRPSSLGREQMDMRPGGRFPPAAVPKPLLL